jgi:hypothetical protein
MSKLEPSALEVLRHLEQEFGTQVSLGDIGRMREELEASLGGWANSETATMWRWLSDDTWVRRLADLHRDGFRADPIVTEDTVPDRMVMWLHQWCERVWRGEHETDMGEYIAAGRYEFKYGPFTRDVGSWQRLDFRALVARYLAQERDGAPHG